jgi:hypothetical protein
MRRIEWRERELAWERNELGRQKTAWRARSAAAAAARRLFFSCQPARSSSPSFPTPTLLQLLSNPPFTPPSKPPQSPPSTRALWCPSRSPAPPSAAPSSPAACKRCARPPSSHLQIKQQNPVKPAFGSNPVLKTNPPRPPTPPPKVLDAELEAKGSKLMARHMFKRVPIPDFAQYEVRVRVVVFGGRVGGGWVGCFG